MSDKEIVISHIREAFADVEYPGDDFLQGSFDGCEPYEVVGPFRGRYNWQTVGAEFLDAHNDALSFFSEGGFRFFLPAYLVADLQDALQTADPVFHLTHGFSDGSVEVRPKTRTFVRRFGKSAFINPRRYGAITFHDYARYRLSVFTKEEAQAIVAYLRYKRDLDPSAFDKDRIDAALNGCWLERATNAPSRANREHDLEEEARFLSDIDPHVE